IDGRSTFLDEEAEIRDRSLERLGSIRDLDFTWLLGFARTRESEQCLNQSPHPLDTLPDRADHAVGVLVKARLVAMLQQLGVDADRAKRLLEVVPSQACELTQVYIRFLKLFGLAKEDVLALGSHSLGFTGGFGSGSSAFFLVARRRKMGVHSGRPPI